jgi:hypothetical protein
VDLAAAVSGAREAGALPLLTVYQGATDFPGVIVVRMHVTYPDPAKSGPTSCAWTYGTLNRARRALSAVGLVQTARHPSDDPVIVETWI